MDAGALAPEKSISTRSQLRFVHRNESAAEQDSINRIAQVYRHSDGYPESVLQDLAQLKYLLEKTRTERGPSYATAQFIFLEMLSSMGLYVDEGQSPRKAQFRY